MVALGAAAEVLTTAASCSGTSSSTPFSDSIRCSSAWSGRVFLPSRRGEVFGIPVSAKSWNNLGGKGHLCGGRRGFKISAIDAAQEFDYESMKLTELKRKTKLKVGIVGFGNFGQFLAQRFVKQGHNVLAYSRSDYGDIARKFGVTYFRDADDFCEEHPEVVVLCTSILSTAAVLHSLPVQRLKRSTLFVDVLSVKEFPRTLFLQVLPTEFDVLCTHPMFGPESGGGSWEGLPLVYEKVRVREGSRAERCSRFLNIFENEPVKLNPLDVRRDVVVLNLLNEGCRMVEMSCEEHDRHAAGSQFITHTVGRVLGSLGLESTPINTKGYESLLKLVDNTYSDSFDLYYGLFLYNLNATEELVRLERAFDIVKSQLFDKLHSVLRQQMLKTSTSFEVGLPLPPAPALPTFLATPIQQTLEIGGRHSGSSNNSNS